MAGLTAEPLPSITFTVRGQGDGTDKDFKTSVHCRLGKVWQVYASKVGKDPNQLKFFFDGTRVLDDRTPSDLGLEEGDSIDAMMEQLGGPGPGPWELVNSTEGSDQEQQTALTMPATEQAAAPASETQLADVNAPINLAEDPADQPFLVHLTDARGALPITVRPSTSVRKLLEAYERRRGLAAGKVKLLLQSGQLVADTGTSGQAGLTVGAVLSCLQLL